MSNRSLLLSAACALLLIGSSCFAEPVFRTFITLPQESQTTQCFRLFVPAEASQGQQMVCFKTFNPLESTTGENEYSKGKNENSNPKSTTTKKPKATLITATFYCPPCEVWKRRKHELPFDVTVVQRQTSPITNRNGAYIFPVFEYRSRTGRLKRYQGSVDGFLQYHSQQDQASERTVSKF